MTFYEAALRVLESAGRPLHFLEITEKSIQENLLSHVGKTPDQTMLSRLAAMARRPRDRRVIVTAKDTFGLVDWAFPEDPEALAQTGVVEPNPEEALPPLRPIERHPDPRGENVRSSGRGDRKRHRDDDDRGGRKRRYPPIPEVVYEILSEAGRTLSPSELAERARSRGLASDELSNEKILTALLEDNQRRIDAGRRPQYLLDAEGQIGLERAGSPSEAPPLELQAAFAAALGIPLEGGRPVLPRSSAVSAAVVADAPASSMIKDARRAMAKTFRARLLELDSGTFEKSVVRMLQGLGFREIKVAKRSKDGPLVTTRRKEGSVELRYAVRISRSGGVDRRAVQELRRDLSHYTAQVGLLVTAHEVRGDGRAEAQAFGPLVMLWCGDALAEKFFEAKAGVTVQTVELYELDERFFEQARIDAEEARARREERRAERGGPDQRADRDPRPPRPSPEAGSAPAPAPVAAQAADEEIPFERLPDPLGGGEGEGEELELDDAQDGGEEDGDLDAASEFANAGEGRPGTPGQPGAPGERKRKRRRRRGRRGRGPRPEGAAPGPEGASAAPSPGGAAAVSASAPTAPREPAQPSHASEAPPASAPRPTPPPV